MEAFTTKSKLYNNTETQGAVWEYLQRALDEETLDRLCRTNSQQNIEDVLNQCSEGSEWEMKDLIEFVEVVRVEGI